MPNPTAFVPKLQAIKNRLDKALAPQDPRRPTVVGIYFDPADVVIWHQSYAAIRDVLRAQDEFSDLPVRTLKVDATTDYEGRGYVQRPELERLAGDIAYVLDILNHPSRREPPVKLDREGVFFAGQPFDAMRSVSTLVKNAKTSIMLVDGYVDETTLTLMSEKAAGVSVEILTRSQCAKPSLQTHAAAFNKQYGGLQVRTCQDFHDRFVVIDDTDFFHFGASIKDLGNKGFMFSRIEEPRVMDLLRSEVSKAWSCATVFI